LKHFADGVIPSSVTHSRLMGPDAQDSWNSDRSVAKQNAKPIPYNKNQEADQIQKS